MQRFYFECRQLCLEGLTVFKARDLQRLRSETSSQRRSLKMLLDRRTGRDQQEFILRKAEVKEMLHQSAVE